MIAIFIRPAGCSSGVSSTNHDHSEEAVSSCESHFHQSQGPVTWPSIQIRHVVWLTHDRLAQSFPPSDRPVRTTRRCPASGLPSRALGCVLICRNHQGPPGGVLKRVLKTLLRLRSSAPRCSARSASSGTSVSDLRARHRLPSACPPAPGILPISSFTLGHSNFQHPRLSGEALQFLVTLGGDRRLSLELCRQPSQLPVTFGHCSFQQPGLDGEALQFLVTTGNDGSERLNL